MELERGTSGWLGTTWSPYGISASWADPMDDVMSASVAQEGSGSALLAGFGLCVDSRDWQLVHVEPGTVAHRLGIAP
eukprot:3225122-Rhodomonas_salina.1